MKKIYSFFMFCLLANALAARPGSLVGLDPDSAFQGQTINVTVTYPAGTLMGASPGDLNFYSPGLPGFTVNWMNVYNVDPFNDYAQYNFQVPLGTPAGMYDLVAQTGYYDIWSGTVVPTDSFSLPQALVVLETNIYGHLFLDHNGNGVFQPASGERYWGGKRIDVSPDNISTYTDGNGLFLLQLPPGSHTIQYTTAPGEIITTGNSPVTVTVTANSSQNLGNIGVQTPASYQVYTSLQLGRRCNRVGNGYVAVSNQSNRVIDMSVTLVKDPNLAVLSATPTAASVSGDTMTWNFTQMQPGYTTWVHLVDSLPSAGDTLVSTVTAVGFNGATPVDTFTSVNQTIVTCAWDPNDKAVTPAGEGIPKYTLIGEDLIYHINFQNTGNDTAFDVIVRDTLDANLNLASFQFIGASSPAIVELNNNTRVVEFRMNNILLPDSNVNEPLSHGFVEYRISHVQGIADGTAIYNTANIYFDFNPPIATNTTLNTMVFVIPVGIVSPGSSPGISMYPNPVDKEAIFDLGSYRGNSRLEIWNEAGQCVLSEELKTSQYRLPANRLSPGLYMYQVTGTGIRASGRFVVSGQ